MLKTLMNKKGILLIELLSSLIIATLIIVLIGVVNTSIINNKKHIDDKIIYINSVNNTITDLYNTFNWDELELNSGGFDTAVDVEILSMITDPIHKTNKLEVRFSYKDLQRELILERSSYFGM